MILQVNKTYYTAPYLIHTYGTGLYGIRNTYFFVRVLFKTTYSEDYIVKGNLTVIVWYDADLINKVSIGIPVINETIPVIFNIKYGGYIGFTAGTGSKYGIHAIEWFHVVANTSIASVGGELINNNIQPSMHLSLLVIAIVSLTTSIVIIYRKTRK